MTRDSKPHGSVKIEAIILSIEKETNINFDPATENTDVIVKMENGATYIASFFTFDNIEKLRREHVRNGEFLSGKYFKVDNMVLIDNCLRSTITEVVEHLIDEGDFERIFQRI